MVAKELVIISGKGGTGKSSIVSSFATLADNKVIVDCDVDASDLHLIFKPTIVKKTDFYSGKKAKIDSAKCIKCGKCQEICHFDAIQNFKINEMKCEGCGSCFHNCPNQAIEFNKVKSGEWYESNSRFGKLIHAKLGIAEENSGKLVSEIKNYARIVAKENDNDLIIVDGSPGIGCPVISSISGATLLIVVTEPTLSGLHDAERVLELARHFGTDVALCINKFDINLEMSNKIEEFCRSKNIEVLGKIPYNKDFTKAMIKQESLIEYNKDSNVSKEIKKIWYKTLNKLQGKSNG